MSNRPDKCRWCGLHEADDGTLDTVFACGSSWRCRDMWFQSTGCEEIVELRQRIAAAVEATQQANRFGLVSRRHGGIAAQPDSTGCYAWASVLDDIAAILQGNSPEIPEGST